MNEIIEKFINENVKSVIMPREFKKYVRKILTQFTSENNITVWYKIESEKDCPDDDRYVYIHTIDGETRSRYVNGRWELNTLTWMNEVIAWCELPKYKGV